MRYEPHLVGCPRWGTPKKDDRTRYETHEWDSTESDMECIVCGVMWSECDDVCPANQ